MLLVLFTLPLYTLVREGKMDEKKIIPWMRKREFHSQTLRKLRNKNKVKGGRVNEDDYAN